MAHHQKQTIRWYSRCTVQYNLLAWPVCSFHALVTFLSRLRFFGVILLSTVAFRSLNPSLCHSRWWRLTERALCERGAPVSLPVPLMRADKQWAAIFLISSASEPPGLPYRTHTHLLTLACTCTHTHTHTQHIPSVPFSPSSTHAHTLSYKLTHTSTHSNIQTHAHTHFYKRQQRHCAYDSLLLRSILLGRAARYVNPVFV